MNEEKKKQGISVKELEGYAKKHRFEIFFCILFVFASLFTLVFWGPTFSIFCVGIGTIFSIFLPLTVEQFARKMTMMVFTKEATTQLIIGILAIIVAIFIAPVIFLFIGLFAGKSLITFVKESS